MSNEEIYKECSDNPIEWMKKNECVTSKDITLKMMDIALKQGQNLPLHNIVGQSESFICDHCDKGFADMSKKVTIDIECYNKLANK